MNEGETINSNGSPCEAEGQQILSGIKDVVLDPTEVDKIWDLHPLKITHAQRAVIIEQIRRSRERFQQKPKRTKKPSPAVGDSDKLSLDDLDIDVSSI